MLILTVRRSTLVVCRRQILTSKVDPRTVRVKPSQCIKTSLYIPKNRLNFLTTRGFRMNSVMKLVYQDMEIVYTFSPTSSHLHPLQVENYDRNSRLVVDEDDNGKFRLERVNTCFDPCSARAKLVSRPHWHNRNTAACTKIPCIYIIKKDN